MTLLKTRQMFVSLSPPTPKLAVGVELARFGVQPQRQRRQVSQKDELRSIFKRLRLIKTRRFAKRYKKLKKKGKKKGVQLAAAREASRPPVNSPSLSTGSIDWCRNKCNIFPCGSIFRRRRRRRRRLAAPNQISKQCFYK